MENGSYIQIMKLQARFSSLTDEELNELKDLLLNTPCKCQKPVECKGICAAERRVRREQRNRNMNL